MIKKIKKIIKSKFIDEEQDEDTNPNERQYTFMLTKDGIGKSVTVTAPNHIDAEKELKENHPDSKIQFLWEWK